jgi:predicted Zn-ribbon and HTH transcriptional regulator
MPTIREQMIDLLSEGEHDAYEVSQRLRIQEKEVYQHLSHITKSLAARNRRLKIVPAACVSCGFSFKDRGRLKKPGRCPMCRSERIRSPRYTVV